MKRAPFVVTAVGFPGVLRAQGPTFDCAKAQGEGEALCGDASLGALDR